jgi:transposase
MEDASPIASLPDDVNELKQLLIAREEQLARRNELVAQQTVTITDHQGTITSQQNTIAKLTQQRDEYYLEKLRLEVRLAKALKQAYGPRADRVRDLSQLLLGFGEQLDALPIRSDDLPVDSDEGDEAGKDTPPARRRLRTRGRRDIGKLDHLPLIEQVYELTDELCRCPSCQAEREKIGSAISYTVEYMPGSLVRIKHVQHKYACHHCEQNGHNPNITLAAKTNGSPIDKGLPGPGLLAYVVTSKFADYVPLHRLENIFAREGFELDRSTMCIWMADVARLVRPLYDRMVQRVLQSHVLATDDTVMPMQHPGKTKKSRMWIYQGDESHPYNVFEFTASHSRDGPARFLANFRNTLLADAYGGYDGIVLNQELPRAGCWAHARRKFIDCQAAAPQGTHAILRLIKRLFSLEKRLAHCDDSERLRRRQAEAVPLLDSLRGLLLEQKAELLPKHPLTEAIQYTLNQWSALTLFITDPAVPIHNNLAEQQMKRIALLRKNALFVATPAGGETAAILSTLTSTCRRHDINPQAYLTQLLANLPDTPVGDVDQWLPDEWKKRPAGQPSGTDPHQT